MPDVGDRLVMLGDASTVKLSPLLATPPTVTTMAPEVAPAGTVATINVLPQAEMVVAGVPLNVTVLEPCVTPKPDPLIVTGAPMAAAPGDTLTIAGAANRDVVRMRQVTTTRANCDFLGRTFLSSCPLRRHSPAALDSGSPLTRVRLTRDQYEYVTV